MTLEDILKDIAASDSLPAAAKLRALSALGLEEEKLVARAWPDIALQRRQNLTDELIELAEDNVEFDFAAVFSIGLADRDPVVRAKAIRGLWEDERRETFDNLLRLLEEDPAAAVRAEAALALGRFVMQAEMGTLRSSAAERLENALHRVVEDDGEEVEVRGRALESLGALSEGWVSDLIEQAYDSPERRLRMSAVHAMGRNCDPGWLPMLLHELENDDAEMRFEAAGAAGAIEDETAIPYLLPLIRDDDAEVSAAAIGALGEIGGGTATSALQELLEDGDPRFTDLVLDALAEAEFAEDPLSFSVRGDESNAQSNGS